MHYSCLSADLFNNKLELLTEKNSTIWDHKQNNELHVRHMQSLNVQAKSNSFYRGFYFSISTPLEIQGSDC